MKLCVIFNPAARGEKARWFREHLLTLSAECALRPTSGPGQGRPLAAQAVREGFDTIVAAGGDGTVNEVLNGLGDEPGGLERARLAVLPLGTVNVFAKEISMPARVQDAWDVIRRGTERRLDLAEAEFTAAGAAQRRLFVQMAGAGVDAQAIELVHWKTKKQLGQVAYWIAGCRALARPKPRIIAESPRATRVGEQILIGNGRFYGGRFRLFPLADLQDGLLEVTVLPRANWLTLLRGGWSLLWNRLHALGGVEHFQANSLGLSCAVPVPFHVDGENIGHLPARFSVHPLALRLIAP